MKTTNAIFKLMVGASLIIFSIAALSYTSSNAHANNEGVNNTNMFQPGEVASGKYRIQYTCGLDGNSKFYWFMTISNTETGKFNTYGWSRTEQDWTLEFGGKQAPELP